MQPVQNYHRSGVSAPDKVRPALFLETSAISEHTVVSKSPANDSGTLQTFTVGQPAEDRTVEEQLFVALADAKVWTSRLAMHLDKAARDRIFRQLDVLHEFEEWAEGDRPILLASYKSFVRAILVHKVHRRPSLALMPNGNLVAEWSDKDDKLTVEFLAENRVRWLAQNKAPQGAERATGSSPLERLRDVLQPYGADRWFNGS